MLTIRLQRIGKKKFPTYRLIISEKARDTKGTYLEQLGTYDPHLPKEKACLLKTDRVRYWLEKGAQASGTVRNLLIDAGLIQGAKEKMVYLTKRRQAKLAEKKKAAEAATAAASPASEAAPASTEAPAVA